MDRVANARGSNGSGRPSRLQIGVSRYTRSTNKIDAHLNLALSAVNVAKVEQDVNAARSFSMADAKVLHYNRLLIDMFISILPKGVELDKSDSNSQTTLHLRL